MSPFNKFNVIFALLAMLLSYAVIAFGWSAWSIILLVFLYLNIVAYLSWDIQFHFHLKTYNKAQTSEKEIAITFDDGPTEFTPEVLEILEKFNAKATFFCIGKQIEKHPEILQKIHDAGHIIGNHSYRHGAMFDFLPASKMIEETDKTDGLIEKTIGKKPMYFRPPYGITNPAVKKTVERKHYQAIGWSIRSMDTVNKNTQKVAEKVVSKLHPGAIVLFHDNHDRIVRILEQSLSAIQEKGYKIVPLNKFIKHSPYA